jgi:tetratricopeptide (TPR) repeat protein
VDPRAAETLLDFAERAGPGLRGLEAQEVLGRLEERHQDLLAAIDWFLEQGRTDEALRLTSALTSFWMATKRLDEGSARLDQVMRAPGGEEGLRGRALFDAGYLAFWQGHDQRSSALHDRALELGRRIGDPTIIALALTGLARVALRADVAEARRLCREALVVTEGTEDRVGRSHATHVLAVAAQMAGDLVEARGFMMERLELAREAGNVATVSSEAGNLSMVERQLGNLDRAEALAREALEIDHRRGDGLAMPWKVNGLAAVAVDRGDFERAATLIGVADAMMEDAGGAWPPDERVHYERTVDVATDAMGADAFERARAEGRAMAVSDAMDVALARPPGLSGG